MKGVAPLRKISLAFLSLFALLLVVPEISFAQSDSQTDKFGSPTFTTDSSVATVPERSKTVPHWTSSFTYKGVTYPYTMVGTNPASSNSTTTVDVAIIPFDFVFADGVVLSGTSKVGNVLGSPNFQNATYTSGTTQYGDAVQRAEFWPFVSGASSNWHTLIDSTPTVYPTQVIQVPQNQAVVLVGSVSHRIFALMSYPWFSDRLNEAINSLHIAPTTLPVVLTYNTFLYIHNLNNCCVLGYHGATASTNGNGNQQIQTYIYAAWPDANIFPPGWADVLPMSHEISEWMNDPFIRNFVPPWQFPGEPGSCQGNLETGDPMEVVANSGDDRRIYLPSADGGHPAVVHAGVSLFGDQRRVQLSGHDEADDALATLPIIAKQLRPAAPWIFYGAVFFDVLPVADAKV
jgi:hypothetical protein